MSTHLVLAFEHLFMIPRLDRVQLVYLPLQLRKGLPELLQIWPSDRPQAVSGR